MLKKSTTSTGAAILLGLTAAASSSSVSKLLEYTELTNEQLHAIEVKYNAPETINNERVELYVNKHYRIETTMSNYENAEFAFMTVVQNFSEKQIDLDNDLTEALDELLESKLNNKPSKNRF